MDLLALVSSSPTSESILGTASGRCADCAAPNGGNAILTCDDQNAFRRDSVIAPHRRGRNSVFLHRGHLPATSKGTAFVGKSDSGVTFRGVHT